MEAVEIVVYVMVAVILGGLVLVVTMELASPQLYESVKSVFVEEQEQEFSVITNETAAQFLFSFWEQCNFGVTPENITFQYQGESLSKEEIFDQVKRLRLCNTLSSAEYDCGSREDLHINISTGKIEEGILTAQCYRKEGKGILRICKGSGCEPAPPTPQKGICGNLHNSVFPSDKNAWPNDNFCAQGDVNAIPDFPEQGETATWTCLGTNGGDNSTCTATRKTEEITEETTFSCEGREPPQGMTRAQQCRIFMTYANIGSYRLDDCTQFEEIFNPFPGSTVIRRLAMDRDHYIALEFTTPSHIEDNAQTSLNWENLQPSPPAPDGLPIYSASTIWSVSRCPGDFNKTAIREEGGPGCILNIYTAGGTFRFGGEEQTCTLKEDTTYYLNFLFSEDDIETTPHNEINWRCKTAIVGATPEETTLDIPAQRCGFQIQPNAQGWE